MQIKLTESEIIEIIRQHLKTKNIDAQDLNVETEDSEMIIIAENVSVATPGGRAYTNTTRPVDGAKVSFGPNASAEWSSKAVDDIAEMLGEVFNSFNKKVDSFNKKVDDLAQAKKKPDYSDMNQNPFKPRDSK